MGQNLKNGSSLSARRQGAPAGATAKAESAPRRSNRSLRLAALGIGAALAAALGVASMRSASTGPAPEGTASIGGPFTLTDQDGHKVDQHLLDGHWSAVFFGYTNCPDTCPATLQALNAASAQLSPQARQSFQVLFVSVDPTRDSVKQMKLYTGAQGFAPGKLIGLTGTPAQVQTIAEGYHVYYAKAGSGTRSDYAVQHSAGIYLMSPKGKFSRPLSETMPPKELAGQIETAMRS